MHLGVYTFGDTFPDPATGAAPSHGERLRQVVRMAKLADEVGLDVFAVGEHHRLDMAISSPAVVLAAIAQATSRIRVSSATTVLSTLDPVRVFEDFATLDLLSGERAELLVGRGSFTENFPLFGHDLGNYDVLFEERLDLLLAIVANERVTWQGHTRPPLEEAEVSPRPARPLPVWVGVGGTPHSFVRAGALGLPLNVAILGGPERFVPLVSLYKQAAARAGHDASRVRVAVSSHGHVADDGAAARDEHYLLYSGWMRKGLRNRFPPREVSRASYDVEAGARGALFVGSPREVAEKILWQRKLFGLDRLMLQLDWGGMPFSKVLRAIELLGTEVAPLVRGEG